MKAQDHLVAVSNYDSQSKLPHVGDYVTVDWEKLAALRPSVLITFYAENRTPAGLLDRAKSLGIKVANLRFDRLDDVYRAVTVLGELCNEPAKASAELQHLQIAVGRVRDQVATFPSVRTLIVLDPAGQSFAGRGTYLNDLLEAAGGQNAIAADGYPALDREAVAQSDAQAVIQLLPGADQATCAKARALWDGFPQLPAVQSHRIWIFTEPDVMTPGSHVGDLAAQFAAALHPQENSSSQRSQSSTNP